MRIRSWYTEHVVFEEMTLDRSTHHVFIVAELAHSTVLANIHTCDTSTSTIVSSLPSLVHPQMPVCSAVPDCSRALPGQRTTQAPNPPTAVPAARRHPSTRRRGALSNQTEVDTP